MQVIDNTENRTNVIAQISSPCCVRGSFQSPLPVLPSTLSRNNNLNVIQISVSGPNCNNDCPKSAARRVRQNTQTSKRAVKSKGNRSKKVLESSLLVEHAAARPPARPRVRRQQRSKRACESFPAEANSTSRTIDQIASNRDKSMATIHNISRFKMFCPVLGGGKKLTEPAINRSETLPRKAELPSGHADKSVNFGEIEIIPLVRFGSVATIPRCLDRRNSRSDHERSASSMTSSYGSSSEVDNDDCLDFPTSGKRQTDQFVGDADWHPTISKPIRIRPALNSNCKRPRNFQPAISLAAEFEMFDPCFLEYTLTKAPDINNSVNPAAQLRLSTSTYFGF